MRCPFCNSEHTRVIDSRDVDGGNAIRRRRVCDSCKRRFTTYEKVAFSGITVIKKDGTREQFDRNKMLVGIMKACEKRPVSREAMEALADKVERKIRSAGLSEVNSSRIGEMVMGELLKLDTVAYIRFASVHKNFDSPDEFRKVVGMLKNKKNA